VQFESAAFRRSSVFQHTPAGMPPSLRKRGHTNLDERSDGSDQCVCQAATHMRLSVSMGTCLRCCLRDAGT
jgi:hypothetical protein